MTDKQRRIARAEAPAPDLHPRAGTLAFKISNDTGTKNTVVHILAEAHTGTANLIAGHRGGGRKACWPRNGGVEANLFYMFFGDLANKPRRRIIIFVAIHTTRLSIANV